MKRKITKRAVKKKRKRTSAEGAGADHLLNIQILYALNQVDDNVEFIIKKTAALCLAIITDVEGESCAKKFSNEIIKGVK